jgi:hypothetical protein
MFDSFLSTRAAPGHSLGTRTISLTACESIVFHLSLLLMCVPFIARSSLLFESCAAPARPALFRSIVEAASKVELVPWASCFPSILSMCAAVQEIEGPVEGSRSVASRSSGLQVSIHSGSVHHSGPTRSYTFLALQDLQIRSRLVASREARCVEGQGS